jgi:Mce-associated membrane protein
MDFTKTAEWKERLTKGTSPELAKRLTDAATSMEQITAPLQWTSTSTPINATVRSVDDGKYVVDCFVSVLTKNTQAPEGVQSTATYSVTVDSNNDWLITDVGGIGAMLGSK